MGSEGAIILITGRSRVSFSNSSVGRLEETGRGGFSRLISRIKKGRVESIWRVQRARMINNNSSASKCHAEGGRWKADNGTTEKWSGLQDARRRGGRDAVRRDASIRSVTAQTAPRAIHPPWLSPCLHRFPCACDSLVFHGYRLAKRRTLDKLCLWLRVHVHACISLRFLPFFIRKIESRLVRIRSGTWPRAVISRTSDIDHVNRSA